MLSGLVALVEGLNRYTDIKATFEGRIAYSSSEMLKTPWVFTLFLFPFKMGEQESAHLGEYLTSGGFLFVDAIDFSRVSLGPLGMKRPPSVLTSARHMLKDALRNQGLEFGKEWEFERLANDHLVYHCYFDFDGAPAWQADREFVLSGAIEGICIDGRWVMILSQKMFFHTWDDPDLPELRNERMLQFGINTIIFALTQEGSITHRLMESVR